MESQDGSLRRSRYSGMKMCTKIYAADVELVMAEPLSFEDRQANTHIQPYDLLALQ